jgi:hypothetical protein
MIGDGCNLNRDIVEIVERAGFGFESLRQFYMAGEPKFTSYMTLGHAKPVQPS